MGRYTFGSIHPYEGEEFNLVRESRRALATLEADGIITKGLDQNGKLIPAWLPVSVGIQGGIVKIIVHVFLGGEIDHVSLVGTVSYQQFQIEIDAGA